MDRIALLVVDVQKGFADPMWGERNNPAAEDNIAALIEAWRAEGQPVVFVRHDGIEPGSPFTPGQPGNDLDAMLTGEPDLFVTKNVNSAFHGEPDLAGWLREQGIERVAVCGIQTNMCCETTARVAANLGLRDRLRARRDLHLRAARPTTAARSAPTSSRESRPRTSIPSSAA